MEQHVLHEDLEVYEIIPEHAMRRESAEFRRNREKLIELGHDSCWLCGSKEEIQCHHLFEWCLFNDLDTSKMLDTLKLFDPYGLTKVDPDRPIESPDDIRVLVMLCLKCHIGKNHGIHQIPFPIWIAIRAAKPGAKLIPNYEDVK